MENYEDNLEKTAQHKRNVREATKATRDVGFKDTDSKIRNYDRECKRNVDSDTPKANGIIINTKPLTQTASTVNSEPKTYSWQKPSSAETVKPVEVRVVEPVKQVPAWKKTEIVPKPSEPQKSSTSLKKPENADKIVPKVTEPQQPAEPEQSVPKREKPCTVKCKIEESNVEIEKK